MDMWEKKKIDKLHMDLIIRKLKHGLISLNDLVNPRFYRMIIIMSPNTHVGAKCIRNSGIKLEKERKKTQLFFIFDEGRNTRKSRPG